MRLLPIWLSTVTLVEMSWMCRCGKAYPPHLFGSFSICEYFGMRGLELGSGVKTIEESIIVEKSEIA